MAAARVGAAILGRAVARVRIYAHEARGPQDLVSALLPRLQFRARLGKRRRADHICADHICIEFMSDARGATPAAPIQFGLASERWSDVAA